MRNMTKPMILLLMIIFPTFSNADILKIYTENFPPFNYEKNGQIIGASTEIVKKIIDKTGSNSQIVLTSWNRCLKAINDNTEPVAVFSMGLTEQRQPLYKWVGPIVIMEVVVYGRKDLNAKVENMGDIINSEFRVCANQNSPILNILIEMGLPENRIDLTRNNKLNYKKIVRKRSDFWVVGQHAFNKIVESEGYDKTKIKYYFTLLQNKLYIAFSKVTPDRMVNKWQEAFESIDTNEKQNIFRKYNID